MRIYVFGPANDPVIAAWVTEVSPSAFYAGTATSAQAAAGSNPNMSVPVTLTLSSLGITASSVVIHDWQDRLTTLNAANGSITLNLGTSPVFIGLE